MTKTPFTNQCYTVYIYDNGVLDKILNRDKEAFEIAYNILTGLTNTATIKTANNRFY